MSRAKQLGRIVRAANGSAIANYDHAHKVQGRKVDWSRRGNHQFKSNHAAPRALSPSEWQAYGDALQAKINGGK